MSELLTSAQMRAIERAAIDSGKVAGLELMERAGRGVIDAVFEEWPEFVQAPHSAVVLCGPGNNGGDGFVVARLLKDWGWQVGVYLYGDAENLPPDARANYERWVAVSGVGDWDDRKIEGVLGQHDLIVDALFGTGMSRMMPEDTKRTRHGFVSAVIETPVDGRRQKYVAIDCPSGLCCDSGSNFGALPTDITVSFHARKLGQFLKGDGQYGGGPGLCGKVVVKDIGLKAVSNNDHVTLVDLATNRNLCWKYPAENKFSHGHALILSGPVNQTGAARLAARGALRIGAGLVTVGSPASAMAENAAHLTAIMLRKVGDAKDLAALLGDKRLNALCLGPGLGRTEARAALIGEALAQKRATVLDADALTILSQNPALFSALHDMCVLTPHAGEFARLFPDIAEKLRPPATAGPAYSKVEATRAAAARAGCVVLFKGADTVIADPSGRCSINSAQYQRAAPWLATAGSGDVLAGFITGLLARGIAPMQAAEIAACLHVDCALEFGPGLIAEDLPEILPKVFEKLGL